MCIRDSTNHVAVIDDLNGRVRNIPTQNVVGIKVEREVSNNGCRLRELSAHNELRITNTFFRKRYVRKYTLTARGHRSIIDYVNVNTILTSGVMNTTAYKGCRSLLGYA